MQPISIPRTKKLVMGTLELLSELGERVFAGKWIAGPRIEDAIARGKRFNALGMSAIINYMGEDLRDEKEVADAVATNLRLITSIKKNRLKASVSLKITQLGLRISKELAKRNYDRLVSFARKNKVFVWLDAESHDTIDDAIWAYEGQVRRGGVGIAVQSYLKRSEGNVLRLLRHRAVIRLVKGAYKEDGSIAYRTGKERTQNYAVIMRQLFKRAQEFTIATHDQVLIDEAMRLNQVGKRKLTLAMLNGIRNRYAARLVAEGYKVAIYVPFGTRWIEFSLRRMNEASHIILVLRSLLGG